MATVDEVIVSFEAKMGKYNADLKSSTSLFQQSVDRQSRAIQRLEKDIQRSSGQISSSLKGLAGVLAGAFSVRELVGLLDTYTRFQNSLKVAGLEGEEFSRVQRRLTEIAIQNGVEVENLGKLYGGLASLQKDLNTTSAESIALTTAVANSIRISGTSSASAAGAILGLNQALAQTRVQSDEYNQILDGARPLLQAAVNASDKYKGSLAKLKQEIEAGKVSGSDLFRILQAGFDALSDTAAKSTLTISQSFTNLSTALLTYFGEADKANGVTAAFAAAIDVLAKNLDVIIPSIAIIASGLGIGLVTNAIAARVALAALSAQAAGTAGALGTMGVAARGAGAALLGAFGGPVGVAISVLTLGIGFLVTQTNASSVAAQANARAQEISANASKSGADAAEQLASAHGKARAEALALANAERENIKQKLASARASLILAQAELARAKAFSAAQNQASIGASTPGGGLFIQGTGDVRKARAGQGVADQQARIVGLEKGLGAIDAAIKAGVAPKVSAVADPKKKKGGKDAASGPTAAEIEARFNNELISLTQQTLSAQQSIAKSADEKAELELRSIELAKNQAIAGINAEKDYSATQKERLLSQVDTLAFEEIERVEMQRRVQKAEELADLTDKRNQNQIDALKYEYDLATSNKDRLRIALAIVEAETASALAAVDAQLLSDDITKAKRQQLQAIRDGIVAEGKRSVTDVTKENQGAIGIELDRLGKLNLGDETERFGVDALKELNAGLADAIVNGGNLGDVLEDTGKRFLAQLLELTFQLLVIKPLLESLGGGIGGGGAGGNPFAAISKVLGFSSGGYTGNGPRNGVAGVVHKGEYVFDATATNRIGVNNLAAMQRGLMPAGGSGGTSVIRLELSGDIDARMLNLAQGASIEVVRVASEPIINRAVAEMFRRAGRPRT